MSTAAAAVPIGLVPTIEETQEAFTVILARKAAALGDKAGETLASIGNGTLAAADRVGAGGFARWVASGARWLATKFGWLIGKPVGWIGERTSVGLLLTSETGQNIIKFAGRVLRWPFMFVYSVTFYAIPRLVLTRFGEKGAERYANWVARLERMEARVYSMTGLVSDITGSMFGADRVWIRIPRRIFVVSAVRNVLWAFVPWAWVRFVVLGMTLFGQAVGTGMDLGFIQQDAEEIVSDAAETITEQSDRVQEKATAGATAPSASPTSNAPATPAKLAEAGAPGKPSGQRGHGAK